MSARKEIIRSLERRLARQQAAVDITREHLEEMLKLDKAAESKK